MQSTHWEKTFTLNVFDKSVRKKQTTQIKKRAKKTNKQMYFTKDIQVP